MTIQTYQIFNYPPNWANGFNIAYSYNTGIFTSEHYKEQRKPLKQAPSLTVSYTVFDDTTVIDLFNALRASLNSIVYLPLWNEPIKNLSTGSNLSSITTNDISKHFNLQTLAKYVIISDKRVDEQLPKVAELSVKGPSNLSFAFFTEFEYDPINTVIFPAMTAVLDSVEWVPNTDTLADFNLTFKSYVTGEVIL